MDLAYLALTGLIAALIFLLIQLCHLTRRPS